MAFRTINAALSVGWDKVWGDERPSHSFHRVPEPSIGLYLFLWCLINSSVLVTGNHWKCFPPRFHLLTRNMATSNMIQLLLQEAASLLLDDGWPEGRELAADDTAQHWRLYLDQCVQSSGRLDHGMKYDLLSSNRPETWTPSSWYESR